MAIQTLSPRSSALSPSSFDTIAYGSSHLDTLCKDLQINQDQLEQFLDAPQTHAPSP